MMIPVKDQSFTCLTRLSRNIEIIHWSGNQGIFRGFNSCATVGQKETSNSKSWKKTKRKTKQSRRIGTCNNLTADAIKSNRHTGFANHKRTETNISGSIKPLWLLFREFVFIKILRSKSFQKKDLGPNLSLKRFWVQIFFKRIWCVKSFLTQKSRQRFQTFLKRFQTFLKRFSIFLIPPLKLRSSKKVSKTFSKTFWNRCRLQKSFSARFSFAPEKISHVRSVKDLDPRIFF